LLLTAAPLLTAVGEGGVNMGKHFLSLTRNIDDSSSFIHISQNPAKYLSESSTSIENSIDKSMNIH
jgi:hypothetical protein